MYNKRFLSSLLVFVMLLTTVFTMPICSFAAPTPTTQVDVNGATYDFQETGTWLGMNWGKFDSDGDDKADTIILYGTQTSSFDTDNIKFAPYYNNNIKHIICDAELMGCNYLFWNCGNLLSFTCGENINALSVTNMHGMFDGCVNLTTVDLSNFSTSPLLDTAYMFDGCVSLTTVDLSGLRTSPEANMIGMFRHCSGLTTVYVNSTFNTSKPTDTPATLNFVTGVPYTIDGVVYVSNDTGTWLGMKYANYDTNSDGKVDTCVLTGTQTEECRCRYCSRPNLFRSVPWMDE